MKLKCTLSDKCPAIFCPHATPHERRDGCGKFRECMDYIRHVRVHGLVGVARECVEAEEEPEK